MALIQLKALSQLRAFRALMVLETPSQRRVLSQLRALKALIPLRATYGT